MKAERSSTDTRLISLVVKSSDCVINRLKEKYNFLYVTSHKLELVPNDICVLLHAEMQLPSQFPQYLNTTYNTVNFYVNDLAQLNICKIEISEYDYFLKKLSNEVKEYDEISDGGQLSFFKFSGLHHIGKCLVFDDVVDLDEFLNKHGLTEIFTHDGSGFVYYHTYTDIRYAVRRN